MQYKSWHFLFQDNQHLKNSSLTFPNFLKKQKIPDFPWPLYFSRFPLTFQAGRNPEYPTGAGFTNWVSIVSVYIMYIAGEGFALPHGLPCLPMQYVLDLGCSNYTHTAPAGVYLNLETPQSWVYQYYIYATCQLMAERLHFNRYC